MAATNPEPRSTEDEPPAAARAVEWLSHFQNKELKPVLDRWKLPPADTHQDKLETIEEALAGGRVPVREPAVLEAMRRFEKFNLPEQQEFLRRCGLSSGGNQIDVLRHIEDHLGEGGIPVDTAFDYIDELHENGEQHLFLFQHKQGRRADLSAFRSGATVLEKLKALRPLPERPRGDREVVRQGLYRPLPREALVFETELESAAPLLVAAYWREELRHPVLYLKWVETREWHTLEGRAADPRRIELRERSVNFLRLDVATGGLEIRLQLLHGNPQKALSEELELLKLQIGRILDWKDFVPVLIEPAIRRLLVSTHASIQDWKVSWTDSGKLGGGVDPEMVRSIFRRFNNFSAMNLTASWFFERSDRKAASVEAKRRVKAGKAKKTKKTRSIKAKLDATTNEVALQNRCSAYELQVVVADIRRGSSRHLRVPELEAAAKDDEALRPILQQVEIALGGSQGDAKVDLRRLARESWFDEERAYEIAERLAHRYPERFELRLSARCPDTGKPAQTIEGLVTFPSLKAIPDSFRCLHEQPRRYEGHPSHGNVEAELIYRPEPAPRAILERIQARLEDHLGRNSARVYTNVLALLLFTVLYTAILLAAAAGFLGLSRLFGGGMAVSLTLVVPFGLVMLLGAGIVIKLLGDPVTRMAVGVLEKLTAIFDPRRGRSQPSAWSTDVHSIPDADPLRPLESEDATASDEESEATPGTADS